MNDSPPVGQYQALRRVAIGVIGAGLALLLLVVILAAYLHHGYRPFEQHLKPATAIGAIVLTLTTCCLGPILMLWLLSRRGWLGWKHLGGLALIQAAAFAYLRADDSDFRHPQSIKDSVPPLPTDRESFPLTPRSANGGRNARNVRPPQFSVGRATAKISSDPAAWTNFLRQNRPKIEAGWQELEPVRGRWDEMARSPHIHLLSSYREYTCAMASLQALDGRGDDAMATLAEVYSDTRKREPRSTPLIAQVTFDLIMNTATYVLATTPVSEIGRRTLARELSATGGPADVQRMVWDGYNHRLSKNFAPAVATLRPKVPLGLGYVLAPIIHLIVNPNRTVNLIGDRRQMLATLAGEQRIDEIKALEAKQFTDEAGWLPIKNCGGIYIAEMEQHSYAKRVEKYWKHESRRIALLERLGLGSKI